MNFKLEDFEGPLDLLLHLVRQSKMDLYKVNIRDIIEQYLEFINSLDKNDIDASSEYLVMSSELVHLKSRMLVNKELDEEEEYLVKDEEDLRNKLIEYEKYKNMTDTFKSLEANRMDYYTKIPENLNEYVDDDKIVNSEVSVTELVNAFLDMQKRVNYNKPLTTRVTKKEYSVSRRINEIRNILKEKKKIHFEELFSEYSKELVIVTFVSLLDMSKNKEVLIKQNKAFSTITIETVVS